VGIFLTFFHGGSMEGRSLDRDPAFVSRILCTTPLGPEDGPPLYVIGCGGSGASTLKKTFTTYDDVSRWPNKRIWA